MSFGAGSVPPWHRNASSERLTWRSHPNNRGSVRPIRPQPYTNIRHNGWSNSFSNPYFSRNLHAQNHKNNYERNRMHFFNQPLDQNSSTTNDASARTQMNEFVKQTLMRNAHVPGLRTGLQMRNAMKQRTETRNENKEEEATEVIFPVTYFVFSEKIDFRWKNPTDRKDTKFVIHVENVKTKQTKTIEKSFISNFYELQVTAGEIYQVSIQYKTQNDELLLASWTKEIRAEFSYSELKQLLEKCYMFVKRGTNAEPQMHEFCVVYRCKPKVYWDEIHHCCNDVMQKYIKDDNGQPGNLINGKINGLFFSARLLPDLTLPPYSPFGNVRMVVNAFAILNPDRHNFYFADFYCNKNIHYVTIVLCVMDSETDKYCRDKLVKLNPLSNPFVKLVPPTDRIGQWRFFINYTLWVELYYTEDIQLDMGQFSAIMATGAGTSKIGGLPNNKYCTLCNLYPPGQKKVVTVEEANREATNIDSTMAIILRYDNQIDMEVAETLTYLIDRVEERNLSSTELAEKLDKDLVDAVENMNKIVARDNTNILASIARNLNSFSEGFKKRRDALFEKVKELKNY